MQCSECRHFKNSTNYRRPNGTCHKHAPKAALGQIPAESSDTPDVVFVAAWPEVPRDESCGDFEPLEQRMTAPEEVRASVPPEPKPKAEPEPPPKPVARPLPPAKEALQMVHDYLETAIEDYSPAYLIVQTQTREAGPTWRIETRYDDNSDYVFVVGPDGILEMT